MFWLCFWWWWRVEMELIWLVVEIKLWNHKLSVVIVWVAFQTTVLIIESLIFMNKCTDIWCTRVLWRILLAVFEWYFPWIITFRIHSLPENNVFSRVCHSVHRENGISLVTTAHDAIGQPQVTRTPPDLLKLVYLYPIYLVASGYLAFDWKAFFFVTKVTIRQKFESLVCPRLIHNFSLFRWTILSSLFQQTRSNIVINNLDKTCLQKMFSSFSGDLAQMYLWNLCLKFGMS